MEILEQNVGGSWVPAPAFGEVSECTMFRAFLEIGRYPTRYGFVNAIQWHFDRYELINIMQRVENGDIKVRFERYPFTKEEFLRGWKDIFDARKDFGFINVRWRDTDADF